VLVQTVLAPHCSESIRHRLVALLLSTTDSTIDTCRLATPPTRRFSAIRPVPVCTLLLTALQLLLLLHAVPMSAMLRLPQQRVAQRSASQLLPAIGARPQVPQRRLRHLLATVEAA
jgi:hypothetical protein